MEIVINSVVFMFVLSVGLGLMIAVFARVFEVKVDPRIEKIIDILPGYNCGACGYSGCEQYAEAVVNDNEAQNKCAPGGVEVVEKIKTVMSEK